MAYSTIISIILKIIDEAISRYRKWKREKERLYAFKKMIPTAVDTDQEIDSALYNLYKLASEISGCSSIYQKWVKLLSEIPQRMDDFLEKDDDPSSKQFALFVIYLYAKLTNIVLEEARNDPCNILKSKIIVIETLHRLFNDTSPEGICKTDSAGIGLLMDRLDVAITIKKELKTDANLLYFIFRPRRDVILSKKDPVKYLTKRGIKKNTARIVIYKLIKDKIIERIGDLKEIIHALTEDIL